MHFAHRPYEQGETVAAIATAPGEGGIAVIRISGDRALSIAEKVFSGPVKSYKTHTAHFGKIVNDQNEVVDEVLLLVMLDKRSYTGEDTVEIHCHGGSLITRKVLETVLKAGARAALPGEFTFKAFMNQKLDLTQAEAVQALIGAQNELALKAAEEQLQGALSKKIQSFQKELTDTAAILEAWVDFPEEGLEFATLDEIISSLEKTLLKMELLASTFDQGKIIKEGLSLCLSGPPNAGKSSLMNALLGKERAIVTDIPGTTRDLLEEDLRLGSLHFRLIDTAGIRNTQEVIEQEGIRRSKSAMQKADLILLVLDATRGITEEEGALLNLVPSKKTILIWNKIDLEHPPLPPGHSLPTVHISAKEGRGLDTLHQMIDQVIWQDGLPSKQEVMITNVRHYQALQQAIDAIKRLIDGLKNDVSPEFLNSDMRQALFELATIIGTDITEEILTAIFSKFCIGK